MQTGRVVRTMLMVSVWVTHALEFDASLRFRHMSRELMNESGDETPTHHVGTAGDVTRACVCLHATDGDDMTGSELKIKADCICCVVGCVPAMAPESPPWRRRDEGGNIHGQCNDASAGVRRRHAR